MSHSQGDGSGDAEKQTDLRYILGSSNFVCKYLCHRREKENINLNTFSSSNWCIYYLLNYIVESLIVSSYDIVVKILYFANLWLPGSKGGEIKSEDWD